MFYNYAIDPEGYYDEDLDLDMGIDRSMEMDLDTEGNYPYEVSGRDMILEDDIKKVIVDEAQAYYYYDALADLANSEEAQQLVRSIQEDEAKHYRWFSNILKRMGEDVPQIPMGEMPSDFMEGVKKSILDELEANEFYQDIAYRSSDPDIVMHFMHAAGDEQRHATLLQNILMTMYIG